MTGVACGVLLSLLLWQDRDVPAPYLIKGGFQWDLFVMRGEKDLQVTEEFTLIEGDRLRIRITAAESGTAFVAVTNQDHELLTDLAWTLDHRQSLSANTQAFFNQNIELTGPAEGETIVLVYCEGGQITWIQQNSAAFADYLRGKEEQPEFSHCVRQQRRLR